MPLCPYALVLVVPGLYDKNQTPTTTTCTITEDVYLQYVPPRPFPSLGYVPLSGMNSSSVRLEKTSQSSRSIRKDAPLLYGSLSMTLLPLSDDT
jgi:hypothetical protein